MVSRKRRASSVTAPSPGAEQTRAKRVRPVTPSSKSKIHATATPTNQPNSAVKHTHTNNTNHPSNDSIASSDTTRLKRARSLNTATPSTKSHRSRPVTTSGTPSAKPNKTPPPSPDSDGSGHRTLLSPTPPPTPCAGSLHMPSAVITKHKSRGGRANHPELPVAPSSAAKTLPAKRGAHPGDTTHPRVEKPPAAHVGGDAGDTEKIVDSHHPIDRTPSAATPVQAPNLESSTPTTAAVPVPPPSNLATPTAAATPVPPPKPETACTPSAAPYAATNAAQLQPEQPEGTEGSESAWPGHCMFLCRACKCPVSNSASHPTFLDEGKRIAVTGAFFVSIASELRIVKNGDGQGCTYRDAQCSKCHALLGRVYGATHQALDNMRDRFILDVGALQVLEAKSAKTPSGIDVSLDPCSADSGVPHTKRTMSNEALQAAVTELEADVELIKRNLNDSNEAMSHMRSEQLDIKSTVVELRDLFKQFNSRANASFDEVRHALVLWDDKVRNIQFILDKSRTFPNRLLTAGASTPTPQIAGPGRTTVTPSPVSKKRAREKKTDRPSATKSKTTKC